MVGKLTTPSKEAINLWARIYACCCPKYHIWCSLCSQFGQDRIVR